MATKILRARSVDILDLIRLAEESNLSPWSARNYLDEFKLENSIILKAVGTDDRIIGFICARTVKAHSSEQTEAEIYNIAVTEPVRREGVGQKLFDAFLCEVRQSHGEAVWLEVRESNDAALSFYRKNGFTVIQARRNFYNNPVENALLMKLELTPRSAE